MITLEATSWTFTYHEFDAILFIHINLWHRKMISIEEYLERIVKINECLAFLLHTGQNY